jgi:AcrR family transcriptional regulator
MASMGRKREAPEALPRPPDPWLDVDLAGIADARERILRTAYALFWRHGVNAVGVDRIVAEAGVAKTTLYRHFGSKEGLVVAVIERHKDVWTRNWLQAEIERRGRTPRGQLLAIFDAFDDWFRQQPFEGCLFTNTLAEAHHQPAPIRAAAVGALAEVRAVVQDLLEAAGVRDPEDYALRLQLLMWGSITAALNGLTDAAQQARAAAELLLDRDSPAS